MPPRRGGRGRGRGSPQKRNIPPRSDLVVDRQGLSDTVSDAGQFESFKYDATKDVENQTPLVESESQFELANLKNEREDQNTENIMEVENINENENKNVSANVNANETASEGLSANVSVTEAQKSISNETQESVKIEGAETMGTTGKTDENENKAESVDLPYKVKVSHLPATYVLQEFQRHLLNTFNLNVEKIISPGKNSPWLLLPFATKEEQGNCIRLLHNHIWKKKSLRAITFYTVSDKHSLEDGQDSECKKLKLDEIPVLSLEDEILSESLPLYNVPYEEQNRLTIQDVQLLSNKLHAFMCVRNPDLAGWAEAMTEKNNGCIFKIEPLKPSVLLEGYRNKCKFRIGKNTEGETTVGFCLNDNENKILGVQPGDKLIHLPDSMKYAAKKFEEFIRTSGKEPYDKKQRTGYWHHIIIRIAPEGRLMLVIVTFHDNAADEVITEMKNEVKEYFVNGNGKDCKLYSLYFQIMNNNRAPMLPPEKLELLHGEPYFYETICGLKFYAGPFSILNVNSSSSENIYNSIAELAEPTKETTILDLCSGTGGIAFTIADKCKKVIAIETQDDHIKDALKTKEINNIENVEFVKGKVEDVLSDVFEKLGDAPVIPIIDPPRQGLVQKAISQLRSRLSIQKLVYVCSNSKMGAKNFLDLCASSEKKEGTFGNPLNVVFAGLPFLPVRAIPIDVAPYTVNNTIIILFERVDPSTFPPAKQPPPQPLKRPQVKADDKKRKRSQGRRVKGVVATRGRKFRPTLGMKGNFRGTYFRKNGGPPRGGFHQNRFPEPLIRPLDPALSLVAKYERRIAELEQQDRAFKAGLTMGLQALNPRGGPGGGGTNFDNFGNSFNSNLGSNFGNFRNPVIGDNPAWQRGGGGGGGGGGLGGGGGGGGGGGVGGGGGGGSGGGGRNFDTPGMSFGGGSNFGGFMGGGGGGGFNNFNSGGGFSGFSGGGNFNSSFHGRGNMKGRGFRGIQGNRRRR